MARWLIALLVCAALCVWVWFATVWNNFAFRNGLIADDYLLPVATLALLVIVLGLNPILRRFAPGASFSRRWLAVMGGVLFMAALPPSAGILRQLAFPLGAAVQRANTEQPMAKAYEALDAPDVLYPDTLEYNADLPVAGPFIDELGPGETIRWEAWVGPILAWSGFVIPWYVMMVALAAIMSKYWQDEERVPFPLVMIFRSLVDVPDDPARRVPPIFKNRAFWIGCGIVFALHALAQGHRYFPGAVPEFPLRWQMGPYFRQVPWNYLGWWIKNGQLFFSFMAVAFFLSNRTSFSIWSIQVVTAGYMMIGRAYFPPFKGYSINDTRSGAVFAFALLVAWLGRRHMLHVARCMVRAVSTAQDRAYRLAGWCFAAGCAGMAVWFSWVDVPPVYALLFVVAAVLTALTLMRVVAETGLPLFFLGTDTFLRLLRLLPLGWRTLATMYFGGLLSTWLGSGQRVCVGAVAAQAMAINREDDVPKRVRLGGLFLVVLAVSLVGGWLVILLMGHHHSQTPCGRPVAWWGIRQFRPGEDLLLNTISGISPSSLSEHLPYLAFGGLLVVVLAQLCQMFPAWPLHPIGLLGAGTWCVAQIWPNVFLGWLIRNLLIKIGGTRAYNAARPFFIGVLMGELFALFLWSAISGALALNEMEFHSVNILPY